MWKYLRWNIYTLLYDIRSNWNLPLFQRTSSMLTGYINTYTEKTFSIKNIIAYGDICWHTNNVKYIGNSFNNTNKNKNILKTVYLSKE